MNSSIRKLNNEINLQKSIEADFIDNFQEIFDNHPLQSLLLDASIQMTPENEQQSQIPETKHEKMSKLWGEIQNFSKNYENFDYFFGICESFEKFLENFKLSPEKMNMFCDAMEKNENITKISMSLLFNLLLFVFFKRRQKKKRAKKCGG